MQRNHSIDSLKFLCAILVIFIHTPWIYQDAILPITRCAVPCFFMISGYLLFNKKEGIGKERIKRNLRRVFKITLWATIVFIVWKEGINIKSGGYIPSDSELLQWLFLNECPFSGHLWYLYAYIYVLLIVGVVDIYRKWNVLLNLIPLLLLSDLAFGKYSMVLFGKEFPFIYVRNFLFVGLPYFSLGVFLKSIDIFKFLNKNTIRFVRGGVILFSSTSYLERFILISIGKSPTREHYISSTFLAICLFILFLSFGGNKSTVVSRGGEKDSIYIYVLHPLMIWFYSSVFTKLGYNEVYFMISPFIVFVATEVLILLLRRVKLIA